MPGADPESDRRVSGYLHAVLDKDGSSAEALVRAMIDEGSSLLDVYGILGTAQVEVGRLWEKGVITVSDEHFATEVTLKCVSMAADRMKKFRREPKGFAVLYNAEGEFHNVGLRMLSELLRDDGWETELHVSGSLLSVLRDVTKGKRVDLLCLSATMPSSVPRVTEAVRVIRNEQALKSSKVLVGGPAFEDVVAKEVLGLVDCVASSFSEALAFSRSVRSQSGAV